MDQDALLLPDRLELDEGQMPRGGLYARSLIEASLDPMMTIDADGKITDVNQATERVTGIPRTRLIGREFAEFFVDPEQARAAYQQVLAQGAVKDCLLTIQHAESGRLTDVSCNVSLYYDAVGRPQGVFAIARDMTERQLTEDTLRASLRQVERCHDQMITLNRMNNLLLSCETRTEACEVIQSSAGTLFAGGAGGLAIQDEETAPDLRVVATWGHQHLLPEVFPPHQCWALRGGEPYEVAEPACRVPCRHFIHPPTFPYVCVPLAVRGELLGLLHVGLNGGAGWGSFADWCDLALKVSGSIKLALFNLQLQESLRQQSIHDRLTGLFNRRYLDELLPRELNRCQRTGAPLTVAMLDLDHFKGFNDQFGHEAGDAILGAAGHLLLRFIRAGDHACRYGGEELTLVLPEATLDGARARLDRLRQAMARLRIMHRNRELPTITVSIGAAAARPGERDAAALLSRADTALYCAKQQGRNRVVVEENE